MRHPLTSLKIIFLVLGYTAAVNAQAQSMDDDTRAAIASFIAETTECSVFYGIIGQGKDASGNQMSIGKKFQTLSEDLILTSADLAKKIGMKPETVFAMAEDYSAQMGKKIGFDAINIRILTNEYGASCKELTEDPMGRLTYWMKKEAG